MSAAAYALFFTFAAIAVVVGIVATRLGARIAGGPRGFAAHVIPTLAGFGAFYLIGHKLGLHIGPAVELFGFQVTLLGDVAIGFTAALLAALAQAAVVRSRRRPTAA